ncbi:hypothetical protein QP126_12315, partial [Lactobacillus crispatus]|nr:hypothetical protein [Lactobacillus crispatus]
MTISILINFVCVFVALAVAELVIRARRRRDEVLPYIGNPPTRAHKGDAGLDLTANENIVIPSMGWRLVPTGTQTAIPKGQAGLICPRSGLAA